MAGLPRPSRARLASSLKVPEALLALVYSSHVVRAAVCGIPYTCVSNPSTRSIYLTVGRRQCRHQVL